MVLTLVAELLAGETLLTPGGPVDAVTAAGLEPQFLWQEWTNEVVNGAPPSTTEAGYSRAIIAAASHSRST